jgi:hypothetical protein
MGQLVPLRRGARNALLALSPEQRARGVVAASAVGLYKLNAVDPQLESAWVQVISHQVISWFQS